MSILQRPKSCPPGPSAEPASAAPADEEASGEQRRNPRQPAATVAGPDVPSPPAPPASPPVDSPARRSGPLHDAVSAPGQLPLRTVQWAVLTLAVPVLGEQLLWMLLSWSDLYLAGGLANADDAIASVGWGGQFMWVVNVVFMSIAVGATAIVARAIGAGDRRAANRAARQALTVGIFLGVGSAVVGVLVAPTLLRLFGLHGQVHQMATLYVRILVLGMSVGVLEIIGAACLRGAGNTRAALLVVGGANVVNIAVSWTLCRGLFGLPAMGLTGIALGTCIAFVLGGLTMVWLLHHGLSGLKVRLLPLSLDFPLIRRILRVGVFSGVEGALMAGASLSVSAVVTKLSTADFAAYIASLRLESASFLPGMAFATAGGALVGQSLGAMRPDRASRCGWWAYIWGGGIMTVMGILFVAIPGPLAAVFTRNSSPAVVANTKAMLQMCGAFQPFLAAVMIFAGCLRGAGDTRFPLLVAAGGVGGVRVPGAIAAARLFKLGVLGVWGFMMADLVIRGLLVFVRFFRGRWKKVQV